MEGRSEGIEEVVGKVEGGRGVNEGRVGIFPPKSAATIQLHKLTGQVRGCKLTGKEMTRR